MTPLVIKVGGALLDNPAKGQALFAQIKQIQATRPVVLVHGGGALVENLLQQLGLPSVKKDGLRVTPQDQLPYITGMLAGTANRQLCALGISQQLAVVGLSLMDGDMTECHILDESYGAVGKATPKSSQLIQQVLHSGCVPVISSIGCDATGQLLNVNADDAATTIAQLVNGELLLLSDVPGVLDANKQRLTQLTASQIHELAQQGVITDGMLVKVNAASSTAQQLNAEVIIASWADSLTTILSGAAGTRILPEE